MHPLKEDPLYEPCADIIRQYEICNQDQFKRFTNQCHVLYESMTACMKVQVRVELIVELSIHLDISDWQSATPTSSDPKNAVQKENN